ncbi:MAG TPA: sigma-70 family RNA polymerase sigma factor [Anaerolineales bacterium]|jgi:RNA polymerase sigma-70 factor (ECF subfamily)|nr:sigma-70 family RNA polymerase sigma factor [Anaerolineales bacterium]
MPEPEQHLIQRAQKGDPEAFAVLVAEHQRYVYNLAQRILQNEEEALDLAQETFVRAWTALPNFRGQSLFRTWLYRIVTNLCYNRLPHLRQSLTELGDDVIAELPEPDTAFGDPVYGTESRELRSYLHQAIDHLDENYRLLIALRYQNELSYEEIATMLNLPLGTVKTGLFRAKQQLRRALETYQEPLWTIP